MSVEFFQFTVLAFIALAAFYFIVQKLNAWWNVNKNRLTAKLVALLTPKEAKVQTISLSEPHPDLVHVEAKFKELGVRTF